MIAAWCSWWEMIAGLSGLPCLLYIKAAPEKLLKVCLKADKTAGKSDSRQIKHRKDCFTIDLENSDALTSANSSTRQG
jgi:hypothetical protein